MQDIDHQQSFAHSDIWSSETTADVAGPQAHRLLAIGQMTAGLVHDIRNLLASIDSGIRLGERSSGLEDARTYMQAARDGVARAEQLTSHILNFATHGPAVRCFANVNNLISDLLPLLKCAAGADIRIKTKLAPNIPPCLTEVAEFQNAILNLVINARDARPRDGVVRIITGRDEVDGDAEGKNRASFVRVAVQDHGTGIPPAAMQRIFAPFFTTKGKAGTGLGLPQVRAFMQSVNGRLEITSDCSFGTCIHLLFATNGSPEISTGAASTNGHGRGSC
jgi:signal transduction histidine kinase